MFGIALAGLIIATLGTGYGIYASQQARDAQARAGNEARAQQEAQAAKAEADLRQQRIDSQTLLFQQQADQDAANKKLAQQQADALTTAKGEIATNQTQLGSDLLNQQKAAYTQMAPQMETRLNALGLLQSGALPEAQAKYQAQLESQRQATLAQYGTTAQTNLTNQGIANTSADVSRQSAALSQQQVQAQQNLSQNYANSVQNNMNNYAGQQYVGNMNMATNQANQQVANSYMQLGGQIGSGLINYYGSQQNQPYNSIQYGQNPSMGALNQYRSQNQWGTDYSSPVTSY